MIRRLNSLALSAVIIAVEGVVWAAELLEQRRRRSP